MNLKGKLTFGKQQLVLNSAKNKFGYNEEEKINELNNINNNNNNNNDDRKSLNSSTISNQTQPLSSAETGVSSIRNSKEFVDPNNNNKNKNEINNNIINDNNDDLQMQIKYSLKKMSEQYYQYDNKCSLFNYYCSPFINNSSYKKAYYYDNKDKVDIFVNNNKDVYLNCPFESCKDK